MVLKTSVLTLPVFAAPLQPQSVYAPTEDLFTLRTVVPQRIDHEGTKIEDLAGTGEVDALGG